VREEAGGEVIASVRALLCAVLLGVVGPVGGCIELVGQPEPPESPAPPGGPRLSDGFTLHWMTTTDDGEVKRGFNWSERFEFGGLPVRRDAVVLYEHWFADDVREKGFGMTRESGYRDRLRARLRECLDKRVPARDFGGMICIDIEFACPWWGDRTNGPGLSPKIAHGTKYYDEWEKYIERSEGSLISGRRGAERERALGTSYESAVRAWFTMVVESLRDLRPAAKLAFYGIPNGSRHDSDYVGTKGEGVRALNDRARWMVELTDCVMLPLYQDKVIVRGLERQSTPREITEAQGRAFIETNITEAKRLAGEKPVYVLASLMYPDYIKDYLPDSAGKPLNAENLDAMLRMPKRYGAAGLIFWTHFDSAETFRSLQREFSTRARPVLEQVVDR
jgi:hypothetical protein